MKDFSVVMQMERITAHNSDFSLFWEGVKAGWQSISDTFSRKESALNPGGPAASHSSINVGEKKTSLIEARCREKQDPSFSWRASRLIPAFTISNGSSRALP